jgi:hypothetical protein
LSCTLYTLTGKQISINIQFRSGGKLYVHPALFALKGNPASHGCACVGPFRFAPSERVYICVCVPPAGMNYSQPHAAVAAALSQITATHMQTKPEHARCFLTPAKGGHSTRARTQDFFRAERERGAFQITTCLALSITISCRLFYQGV